MSRLRGTGPGLYGERVSESLAQQILDAAVESVGGSRRDGQVAMCEAVAEAFRSGVHVLVQAGTGTGKSLGYLAPVFAQVLATEGSRAVVATATLALQTQLATKDVPMVAAAAEKVYGRRPRTALVKGRSNYACLYRVRGGASPTQAGLLDGSELVGALKAADAAPESVLGAEVVALREWAEDQLTCSGLADRDDAPPHSPAAWAQVSIPVRECLGAARCPYGSECFVEASRERARQADLVVTNHALLAIDALHGGTALPEHDLLVIDEAHELTTRVTGAASAELSPQLVERVGKRVVGYLSDEVAMDLLEAADALRSALGEVAAERVTEPDSPVAQALARLQVAARAALSGMGQPKDADPERAQARGALQEVFDIAERMAGLDSRDVVWVSERERAGRQLVVAPLSVSGLVRDVVLADVAAVFTSATLTIGGTFRASASQFGLGSDGQVDQSEPAEGSVAWRGVDVGSPFDYRRQAILYLARHLPPPGRDGLSEQVLAEIAALVEAAGGRTLGLFASYRNAVCAAEYLREHLALPMLCQGDAHLADLTRRFADDPQTSLLGTLSLWQGLDVAGASCQLVIIDKIPFPRPDDPLLLARQQAVTAAGGNGFLQVAANHAGLLLAQGAGRLIRRISDRGVVAVLDSRLVTARYGSYLRSSMPPFWQTTDPQVVRAALRRLVQATDAAEH